MGYLISAILIALAAAISVYSGTASLLLAFLAYSAAGTFVLISALIAEALFGGDID